MLPINHVTVIILAFLYYAESDRPCIRKIYLADSFVCLCNSTYCDDISRPGTILQGKYLTYTTGRDKYRFEKGEGFFSNNITGNIAIEINKGETFQTIIGFGGAVTDSTGINILKLTKNSQENLYESYFGKNGIEYNLIRVPIGGSDFSTRGYSYNDLPIDDINLSNFSLAYEDIHYKIPTLKKFINKSQSEVYLFGSCWSPPAWMKTNKQLTGFGQLEINYYQTYADYHVRFLEEYDKLGLKIWGLTTGNEPMNGNVPSNFINALGWMPFAQADWIQYYFGPTLRNHSTYRDIKILGLDDNRYLLPTWIELMKMHKEKSLDYLDGIAVHWYFDKAPASFLTLTYELFPNKFILSTEACEGYLPWQIPKAALGSWSRAEAYALDIIEDLNHHVTGWVDWNMVLDKQGGPNWVNNFVDSPVISLPESDEFAKQPMFYIIGHFSKFLPRGSKRVKSQLTCWKCSIKYVVFIRPDNVTVLIIYNRENYSQIIKIKDEINNITFSTEIPEKSIQTILF